MAAGRTTTDRVLAVLFALFAVGHTARLILEDFSWLRLCLPFLFGYWAFHFWTRHGDRDRDGSFGHWLRDRDWRESAATMFEARDEWIERDREEEPDWDRVVAEALAGDEDEDVDVWIAKARVREGGVGATRAMERAIASSPKSSDKLAFLFEELGERGSKAALATARACVKGSDATRVAPAMLYLASVAEDAPDLEAVAGALKAEDGDDVARTIRRRLQARRCATSAEKRFFESLLEAYRTPPSEFHVEEYVRALLVLDAERTLAALVPEGEWPQEAWRVKAIVNALHKLRFPLPDLLHAGLAANTEARLRGQANWSESYAISKQLSLLLAAQAPEAKSLLASALESDSMDLRGMAMDVQLESFGLAEWSQRLYAMQGRLSFAEAPYNEQQRVAIAAYDIVYSVLNGGLCNLYSNGAEGGRFAHRHKSFQAVGASKLAHVIERADAIFGPDGPPEQQEAREDRVGELFDEIDDSPLFSEFCEHSPEALYLTSCYVLEHRKHILERLPDLDAIRRLP